MTEVLYLAIDLGAGSGRVFLAGLSPSNLFLEEVRRFQYPARHTSGHLRWNLQGILDEIGAGTRHAAERAILLQKPICSIGVDSWGVDYGLIDEQSALIEDPISYRDERTLGTMERVFELVPREELFSRTGIQFLNLNTIFQLFAHTRDGLPGRASQLLLIPDLCNLHLTGRAVTEYTNATTTQLVNAHTSTWDVDLMRRLDLPDRLLGEIVAAGTDLGPLTGAMADEPGLRGVRVIAPATHDTGSAVAGAPIEKGWAYISSGTWSLVGIERQTPLIDSKVARENFTNEGGAYGTVRFLKNVMGLWILESCRREWQQQGYDLEYEALIAEVQSLRDSSSAGLGKSLVIFPDDPRLFNPPGMLEALSEQFRATGQRAPTGRQSIAIIAKAVLDSLALRYASVLRTIESLTGERLRGVQIVGGGSRNNYLNQVTADATGLPVATGPGESTVIGNVLVQAVTGGRFASLSEARQYVARNLSLKRFFPAPSSEWPETMRRYNFLEHEFDSKRTG
jgi:rhamnulokinase